MSRFWSPGVDTLNERLYRGDRDPYPKLVAEAAAQSKDILVFGAGRGNSELDFRGEGRRVAGLDLSEEVYQNPYLDEAACYNGGAFPFASGRFDLCCAYSVLEHLSEPLATLREIARVLRPGGRFVFRTSNLWFYACLISRVIPNRFHPSIVRLATGRAKQDTFPTRYRANTRRRLRSLLKTAGFRELSLHVYLPGAAGYLEFSLPTYLVGVLYERITNSFAALEDLRASIVGDFAKIA